MMIFIFGMGLISLYIPYYYYFQRVSSESWDDAIEFGKKKFPGKFDPKVTAHPETNWLFFGPRCSKSQDRLIKLAHRPVMFWGWLRVLVFQYPVLTMRIAWQSFKAGKITFTPEISFEILFEIITFSPLMMVGELTQAGTLIIKIPDDIPLETEGGLKVAGLTLELDSRSKKLVSASQKGRNLIGDSDDLCGRIVHALAHWAHPQTHMLAELSAREIAQKEIGPLKKSERFVNALHTGLFYHPQSPLKNGHSLSTGALMNTALEGLSFRLPHKLDVEKMQFRYYNFLFKARLALCKLLKENKYDINPEFLFNNMIVHSVDHYMMYKNLKKISAISMDGSKSIKSYYRFVKFRAMWVPHLNNPIVAEERLSKFTKKEDPFYYDLYQKLKTLDKEMANSILASTSF